MLSEDKFDWVEQNCCCCNNDKTKIIGYRGGDAHVGGKGIKCTIVRCSDCGHIYPFPMPNVIDTNEAYKDADTYFYSNDPEERFDECRRLLSRIQKKYSCKGRLLDVGSGRGELLFIAKDMGWEVQGVETSKEFATYSRQKYNVEVKNCTLESAGYPSEYFDFITLQMVIEHLYQPKIILEEIHRILKKNGLLWLTAPNELSLYNQIGNLFFKIQGKNWVTNLSPTFDPYHVQGFTKKSLRTILLNSGFTLECVDTYNEKILLPRSGFKERIIRSAASIINSVALRTNRGTFFYVIARKH